MLFENIDEITHAGTHLLINDNPVRLDIDLILLLLWMVVDLRLLNPPR